MKLEEKIIKRNTNIQEVEELIKLCRKKEKILNLNTTKLNEIQHQKAINDAHKERVKTDL